MKKKVYREGRYKLTNKIPDEHIVLNKFQLLWIICNTSTVESIPTAFNNNELHNYSRSCLCCSDFAKLFNRK